MLVHNPKFSPQNWGCTRPKSRAQSPVWLLCGQQDFVTWIITRCLPGCISAGSWIRRKDKIQTKQFWFGMQASCVLCQVSVPDSFLYRFLSEMTYLAIHARMYFSVTKISPKSIYNREHKNQTHLQSTTLHFLPNFLLQKHSFYLNIR